MPATERHWLSAHLFYHGDLDVVARRMVAPLVHDLTADGAIDSYFFIRHWDGGPHIRLRLLPADGRQVEVERQVRDRAAELFRRWPAPDAADLAAYRTWAAHLARLEGAADYSATLRTNNSLAMIPYRPEHHRFGDGEAMAAVEDHFATCSRVVLGMLGTQPPATRRATVALALILTAWLGCGSDVGPDSGQRPWQPPPAHRAAWDATYARQQDQLRSVARQVHTLVREPRSPEGGVVGGWWHSIARLRPIHPEPQTRLRIADICAHLACNRLGVTMGDEARLRYLANRTLQTFTDPGGYAHVA